MFKVFFFSGLKQNNLAQQNISLMIKFFIAVGSNLANELWKGCGGIPQGEKFEFLGIQ